MATATDELADLTFFALDHGIDSVRGGGPLIPFAVVEDGGGRRLARFVAETLEEGLAHGVEFVREARAGDGVRAVLVYDGYLTLAEGRFDAIYAEGVEAGELRLVLGQRYRPKGRLRRFETIGNPGSLPVSMGRLAEG